MGCSADRPSCNGMWSPFSLGNISLLNMITICLWCLRSWVQVPGQCRMKIRHCTVWIKDITSGFSDNFGPDRSANGTSCISHLSFIFFSSSSSNCPVPTHCCPAAIIYPWYFQLATVHNEPTCIVHSFHSQTIVTVRFKTIDCSF